jgi:predicted ATP-grasp superfamily ATP-dependent carboligase
MIGFVKKSAILAIVLFSTTFAYAGNLTPAPQGGSNMHPAPQGSKETAVAHANENGLASVMKDKEDSQKLRKLRPAK